MVADRLARPPAVPTRPAATGDTEAAGAPRFGLAGIGPRAEPPLAVPTRPAAAAAAGETPAPPNDCLRAAGDEPEPFAAADAAETDTDTGGGLNVDTRA